MKLPLWVTLVVGAAGAAAAYLGVVDANHALIWNSVAGVAALLVPVAHKAVS